MKRTPLPPRKEPLKRGKPPRAKKSVRRSGLVRRVVQRIKNRGKPRFKRGRDPQYLEWIRSLPCALHGRRFRYEVFEGDVHQCEGAIEAAHVKSRGAGGPDARNTIPLCSRGHFSQHEVGIKTWAESWFLGGLDELRRIAAEVYPREWEKHKALGFPE